MKMNGNEKLEATLKEHIKRETTKSICVICYTIRNYECVKEPIG